MSTKPVPEEWARRMVALRFVYRGTPSISALAREAGVTTETARRFVHKIGEPDADTVVAISKAMREDMSWWIGSRPASEIYVGPKSSRWLDDRQRLALDELIHAFVKGGSDAGDAEAEKIAGPGDRWPRAAREGNAPKTDE